jgi:hypothetical protein
VIVVCRDPTSLATPTVGIETAGAKLFLIEAALAPIASPEGIIGYLISSVFINGLVVVSKVVDIANLNLIKKPSPF